MFNSYLFPNNYLLEPDVWIPYDQYFFDHRKLFLGNNPKLVLKKN